MSWIDVGRSFKTLGATWNITGDHNFAPLSACARVPVGAAHMHKARTLTTSSLSAPQRTARRPPRHLLRCSFGSVLWDSTFSICKPHHVSENDAPNKMWRPKSPKWLRNHPARLLHKSVRGYLAARALTTLERHIVASHMVHCCSVDSVELICSSSASVNVPPPRVRCCKLHVVEAHVGR